MFTTAMQLLSLLLVRAMSGQADVLRLRHKINLEGF